VSDDDLVRSAGQLFQGTKPGATGFASFPGLARLVHSFCCVFTLPFDLLLHRHHGIRYLNIVLFVFSFVINGFFASMFLGFAPSFGRDPAYSPTASYIGLGLTTLGFIAYAFRRHQAWPKLLAGEKLYSKSYGVPYLVSWWVPKRKKQLQASNRPLTRDSDPQWVTGYVEPIALIVAGIGAAVLANLSLRMNWAAPTALLAALPSIWGAGVAMLVRGQIDRALFLEKFCDAIDSQLENESLASFIAGKPETASEMGFVIPAAREWKPQSRTTLKEAMIAQNPAFARLFVENDSSDPGDSEAFADGNGQVGVRIG
jgi:hypothetical protein